MAALAGAATATATATSQSAAQCESSKEFSSVTLRDGRKLAYKIHGTGGVPVFALHGMESSRETWDTMLWGSPPQPLEQWYPGVQVIAVDRPGYGDSTSPPRGWCYTDFVDDLAELADKLKLDRFCIAGHSSGGPYALACTALLGKRVVACAAVSSDAPYDHPKASPEFKKSGDFPADSLIRSGYYGGKVSDKHAWKQGPLGWVADWTLERIPYPFELEAITLGPRLTIWYGSKDEDCIMQSAKFLHELIPGAQLREQPRGHGFKRDLDGNCHLGFLREIFTELEMQWGSAAT